MLYAYIRSKFIRLGLKSEEINKLSKNNFAYYREIFNIKD
jgi:hypothetical protein